MNEPEMIKQLAHDLGGEIKECQRLPDGSGFAVMSLPLPKNHWLTKEGFNVPPMPFRYGTKEAWKKFQPQTREDFAKGIREAAKYAIRGATMNGKEMDFDPDALVQNMVVGMLGYHTDDGLSSDEWANPKS